MKKFLALLVAISLFASEGFSQDDVRPAAIGVSFIVNDFVTPARIRSTSLSQVFRDKKWAKGEEVSPGFALSYFKGLKRHIEFSSTLAGSFLRYPMKNHTNSGSDKLLLAADASLNFHMLTDKYVVQPYLIAGVGAHMYGGKYFGAFIPTGLGLKINLLDDAQIFVTTQYRLPATSETSTHQFFHQFGIAGRVGQRKKPVIITPPTPPSDMDKDGIIDSLDKCPTVAGIEKYQGCPVPDTDKDGINDEEDKCPTVAGLARYQGCPIPDTDKDGINDEEDKCVDKPGPASNQGCPFSDTDNDGIPDPEDKCPTLPGTRENQGCPEIKEEVVKKIDYAASNIYFATGKFVLLSKSFKGLDEVARLMKENTDLNLSIDGHTDDVGKDAANQLLSEKRAAAVKSYLVKKGVSESKLISTGYGETMPIADNKTAAGRQKNRRVELKLSYF